MRKFRDIIESPFPVPTNALWLKGSDLKGFINGKWVTIGSDKGKISWNDILGKPEFATVATSGSYNDLSDKPDIPSAYILPNATTSVRGGVLMASAVTDLAGTEDAAAICTKVNALLAVLRTAGILTA